MRRLIHHEHITEAYIVRLVQLAHLVNGGAEHISLGAQAQLRSLPRRIPRSRPLRCIPLELSLLLILMPQLQIFECLHLKRRVHGSVLGLHADRAASLLDQDYAVSSACRMGLFLDDGTHGHLPCRCDLAHARPLVSTARPPRLELRSDARQQVVERLVGEGGHEDAHAAVGGICLEQQPTDHGGQKVALARAWRPPHDREPIPTHVSINNLLRFGHRAPVAHRLLGQRQLRARPEMSKARSVAQQPPCECGLLLPRARVLLVLALRAKPRDDPDRVDVDVAPLQHVLMAHHELALVRLGGAVAC